MKDSLPIDRSAKRSLLNKPRFFRILLCLLLFGGTIYLLTYPSFEASVAATSAVQYRSQDGIWATVDDNSISITRTGKRVKPSRPGHRVRLDKAALSHLLSQAPMEFSEAANRSKLILTLPMPDRTFARFWIEESPIMEASLAARFPEIKTYQGQGIDDPTATTRFDWTPKGFHAIVLSASGTVYVDPNGSDTDYISFNKSDFRRSGEKFHCHVEEPDFVMERQTNEILPQVVTNAGTLHTYRVAVAATGEYTAFQGGTVAQALAAINTTMNRVNGIYQRELSIRMVLIANETNIIYTNAMTDPYTNGDPNTMIGENQSNVDTVIGSANYDIGHVFGTDSGGLASAGVCAGNKARGVTGSGAPVGDAFDVDYVAHEMGHQFGASHTFNGSTDSCGGGNRVSSAAFEPGSGSTIMAYAGICGAEDLQPHSDDYFHVKSLEQIVAFIAGHTCDVETATGNVAPIVNAGADFTIPMGTPFMLTGSGVDLNADTLTFDWEEYDLGTQSPPSTDDGSRPIFRSFNPTASFSRIFPKLSDILNNTSTFGESLPATTRNMTFQLTVRDNRAGGGGVSSDTMQVNVTNSSGPFAVTQPNGPVVWTTGSTQTVTWNVANSTAAPVSCTNVKISLSTDGGNTFPFVLAASTPNDGSQTITVPNFPSTTARVKVEAVGNIFFDISNPNFIVNAPPVITCPANVVTSTDPGACSAVVNFTATATDTDPVTVNCTPASGTAFAKGTTTVHCVATDSVGATDSCSFTVTVNDQENPVISCPANIVTGNDPGQCSALVNPGTATATDNCLVSSIAGTRSDGIPLNAPYPVGTTTITWKATDSSNNSSTCTQTIVVNDVEAPVITASVANSCLWPPNHDLLDTGLSLAVTDNCSPLSAITVGVRVTSDERPEIETQGDGNFSPDAVVTGSSINQVVQVRAERMGGGDGRVYLLRITATDQYNNTALKVLQVGVPAAQGPRAAPLAFCAIDSRPVVGNDAPDGGFFAESPPAPLIGRRFW
jgi:reprolysin-like metallo-peptidase family M12B/HYR domain-containing protein